MLKQEHNYQEFEDASVCRGYQALPEDEIETVYLYAYTDDPEKPPFWNRVSFEKDQLVACLIGVLALALIVGLCFIPNTPAYTIKTITVPAQFTTQELQASIALVPTGAKTDPATSAHGMLTVYNGSFLTEQIPAGFLVSTSGRIEIATDQAVIVPANNPPSDGIATVSAHAIVAGSQGNIPVYSVNQQDGSNITIKNLTAFSGGQDARTEHYVTSQDRQTALETARAQLTAKKQAGMQIKPCRETVKQAFLTLAVSWACQFVRYSLPHGVQVLSVQLSGTDVKVRVKVPLPVVVHVVK